MTSWKVTALAPRHVIEGALLAHEDVDEWDHGIVLGGSEVAEDQPDDWRLEAWLPRKPTRTDLNAIEALFAGNAPKLVAEKLPEVDWVTESQKDVEPIRAGSFFVRTPDHRATRERGVKDFVIPASQAFGTGQHATTAGCLEMLTEMKARGLVVRNLADIGTGTGLLAFAAMHLWPRALATASDIDAVCAPIVLANAATNHVREGGGPGAITMVIADGMEHPVLAARGPYDLIIANILAGPLVELAPHFARATLNGGHLLLAGLLTTQEPAVRAACRRAGFRIAARKTNGDWSILWLRKRAGVRVRDSRPSVWPEWSRKW